MRLIGPKTLKLMTSNHLPGGRDLTELSRSMFSEATNAGIGFGLGFAVTMDPAKTLLPGSPGEFYWGGAASTAFWIDPAEELITIFMAQLLPSSMYPGAPRTAHAGLQRDHRQQSVAKPQRPSRTWTTATSSA